MDKTSSQHIPLPEKIAFGLTDMGAAFVWRSVMVFLGFFYTDVFGLRPADVGLLLLLSRLGDGISDVLVGIVADRTNTRWGKFRPWLIWASFPLAITTIATFTTPDFGYTGKLIYAYVTYNLCVISFTALAIPYNALTGVMSSDPDERTRLTSVRFFCGFGGALLLQGFTTKLVDFFGAGDQATGYRITMIVFCVFAMVLFTITYFMCKERVAPQPREKIDLKGDLKDLVTNKAWLILFSMGVLFIATTAIKQGSILYYFTYVIENKGLAASFMVVGLFGSMLGAGITGRMCARWGRKAVMLTSLAVMGLTSLGLYWCRPGDLMAIYVLGFLSELAAGPIVALFFSSLADSADYSEWKGGRRSTGLVYSAGSLAIKAGGASGGLLVNSMLHHSGYVANVAQGPEALHAIVLLMSVIPAAIAVPCMLIFWFYPLNETLLAEIKATLKTRRAEANPAASSA
jgi:GPH family glycoside/pentoside/hexuronide:cation symporter